MVNVTKFDRGQVVADAMKLFHEKGFLGASTRDIQEAVNLRPGSLYSSFKNKEGIFAEALEHYAAQMKEYLHDGLEEADTIIGGLELFVRKIVIEQAKCGTPSACLVMKTHNELGQQGGELSEQCEKMALMFEQYFAEIFNEAQKKGEVSTDEPPETLGKLFQVQLTGLRTYLNGRDDYELAEEMVSRVFKLIRSF